jgi:hypothetical protein
MVNKDQLEQTPAGQQVLALLAKNFTAEQFQTALTLIEQLYTEDQTVWDAEVNRDSRHAFTHTNSAQRLLLFFDIPSDLARVKNELEQRERQHRTDVEEAVAIIIPAPVKRQAKRQAKSKAKTRTSGTSQSARGRKVKVATSVKKKPLKPRRSKLAIKRVTSRRRSAKDHRSSASKKRKAGR